MIYNLGRVVPLFKGNYDAATTYGFLDVVFYDNSSFVALDTTTGNLPTDTSHWLPVALKGLTQNPTPAQMQQIISEVETYMHSTDFVYDPDYTHIDVINNLTSTSTTNALSANQGKVLNETIDGVSHSVSDLNTTVSNLVVDNLTSTSTTNALSANQGRILNEAIDDVSHTVFDLEKDVNTGFSDITPTSEADGYYVYQDTGEERQQSSYKVLRYSVSKDDEFLITFKGTLLPSTMELIALYNGNTYLKELSVRSGSGIGTNLIYNFVIPNGVDTMKLTYRKSDGVVSVRKTKFSYNSTEIADGSITTSKVADSAITTSKVSNGAINTSKISDNAITTSKVADGAITTSKLENTSPYDKVLETQRTYNLYNDATMFIPGSMISSTDGDIYIATTTVSWGISDFIPVQPNTTYYCSATSWGRTRGYSWFDSNFNLAEGHGNENIAGLHTSPSNAAYFVCNLRQNYNKTVDFMIAESSEALPYKPYNVLSADYVEGLENVVEADVNDIVADLFDYNLRIVKVQQSSYIYYDIYDGNNYIRSQCPSDRNHNFNFISIYRNGITYGISDDIAPMHTFNTTLGGNHAQPITKATITEHGLSFSDIGTEWIHSGNNKKYYIVKIFDSNNIGLLSENVGTYTSPSFTSATTGTITKNGVSKTITAVSSTQLWPMQKNMGLKFSIDGKETEIDTFNKNYYGNVIDVVETYDIINPASALSNLIANAGTYTENPSLYDGNSAIRVEIIYRFMKGLNRLIISNYLFLEDAVFQDIMFSQKDRIGDLSVIKYYIPNSLPLSEQSGFDFRTPQLFPLTSSSPIFVNNSNVQDTTHPCNRVVMYDDTNNTGLSIGVLTDYGVGKNLGNYTKEYFEIRNNTGKIYPHPVDNTAVGSPIIAGNMYSAVMYQCLFSANTTSSSSNRLSMYNFNYNDAEYVYVDYKDSMLDKVVVDDSLNGKTIEVLESRNATLKTMTGETTPYESNNIYNNGFYVNATYVSGETCFIVLKIK